MKEGKERREGKEEGTKECEREKRRHGVREKGEISEIRVREKRKKRGK